jgi:hypothetical protein
MYVVLLSWAKMIMSYEILLLLLLLASEPLG